jgi:hypothetical protein
VLTTRQFASKYGTFMVVNLGDAICYEVFPIDHLRQIFHGLPRITMGPYVKGDLTGKIFYSCLLFTDKALHASYNGIMQALISDMIPWSRTEAEREECLHVDHDFPDAIPGSDDTRYVDVASFFKMFVVLKSLRSSQSSDSMHWRRYTVLFLLVFDCGIPSREGLTKYPQH